MEQEGYKTVKLPSTVPGIGYTLKHRNCVEKLIEYYCKKAVGKQDGNGEVFTKEDYAIMVNRGKCHDMDKLLCSLSYPQLTADYFHRMFNGHHEESMIEPQDKSKYDWIEMIMDMESAKYTKADKQGGGAYAFASQCKPHIMSYLMPYFVLLGLNVEDSGIVEGIKKEVNRDYYETDLIESIVTYIHTTHIHLLDGISRIDDRGYMAKYNNAVPLRHKSTQKPNGVLHQRPNQMCQMSKSIMNRELVHGEFEAQLFDLDKICNLKVSEIKGINDKAVEIVKDMGWEYQR